VVTPRPPDRVPGKGLVVRFVNGSQCKYGRKGAYTATLPDREFGPFNKLSLSQDNLKLIGVRSDGLTVTVAEGDLVNNGLWLVEAGENGDGGRYYANLEIILVES
jgi:hypothetical protein